MGAHGKPQTFAIWWLKELPLWKAIGVSLAIGGIVIGVLYACDLIVTIVR